MGDHPTVGEYEIPRARLDVRGAAAEGFSYRIFWDLDRAGSSLEDAWLEYSPFLVVRSRVGQLKVPFSLEALNSARWIRFSERAMGPLNLAPGRDVGFNVFGRAFDGRLEYAAGVFKGSFAKGAANAGTEKAARLSGKRRDCSDYRSLKECIWAPASPSETSTARWPTSTMKPHLTRRSSDTERARARAEA